MPTLTSRQGAGFDRLRSALIGVPQYRGNSDDDGSTRPHGPKQNRRSRANPPVADRNGPSPRPALRTFTLCRLLAVARRSAQERPIAPGGSAEVRPSAPRSAGCKHESSAKVRPSAPRSGVFSIRRIYCGIRRHPRRRRTTTMERSEIPRQRESPPRRTRGGPPAQPTTHNKHGADRLRRPVAHERPNRHLLILCIPLCAHCAPPRRIFDFARRPSLRALADRHPPPNSTLRTQHSPLVRLLPVGRNAQYRPISPSIAFPRAANRAF